MNQQTLFVEFNNQPPVVHLRLGGSLISAAVYQLKNRLEKLFQESYRFLIFDMSAVEFIDSAGIGLIAQLRSDWARHGGRLVIVQSHSLQVIRANQLESINKSIDFFDDVAAARAYLKDKYPAISNGAEPTTPDPNVEYLTQQVAALERRLHWVEERLAVVEKKAK